MTVYFIQSDCGRIKIGYTSAETPDARLRDLQVGSPRKLTLLTYFAGPRETEGWLHKKFGDLNPHGEWFDPSPLLESAIAYAKRFGNLEKWEQAVATPEAWAEDRAAAGRRPGLSIKQEESLLRHAWERAMVEQAARVRYDTDWHNAWVSGWWPSGNLDRRTQHLLAEYPGDPDSFEWETSDGRVMRGVGLECTIERIQRFRNPGQGDRCAAIWLLACIHELSRSASDRKRLSDRLPEIESFRSELYDLTRSGWLRMQRALPEAPYLPHRCVLSITEFVELCARHCRALLHGTSLRFFWRHGAICGTEPLRFSFEGPSFLKKRQPVAEATP